MSLVPTVPKRNGNQMVPVKASCQVLPVDYCLRALLQVSEYTADLSDIGETCSQNSRLLVSQNS